MAAAASTLLHQLQYDGGDDDKYASDHSDALDDLCASLEGKGKQSTSVLCQF
jgi:hypothetical protein